jgi:tetratricopeptide (TPR) repeat protein
MTTQQELQSMDAAALAEFFEAGRYTDALKTLEKTGLLAVLEEQVDAPDHASLILLVANLYRELGRYEDAERYYLRALAGLKNTNHSDYARGQIDLGRNNLLRGRYAEALTLFEQACDAHENATEPDPIAHARCLHSLAGLHDTLDNRREAKECLTRARTLLEEASASPVDMADLLLKEAWVLCRLDNMHSVVSRARQALAIYRDHKGERHPGTLQAVYQLGRLLVVHCENEEAASLLEGLVTARREMLGEDHPDYATAVAALAVLRLVQGEPGEAEDLARRSLALTTTALGQHHLEVAARHRTLAHILEAGNRFPDAAASYEQSLAIVSDALNDVGDECVQNAETQFDLAEIHEAMGEHHKAVEQASATLDRLDQSANDVRYEQATGCMLLARLRANAGALDEAGALARRAVRLAEDLGDEPLLYGPALMLVGRLQAGRGGIAEASNLIDRAEQAMQRLPSHHPSRMQVVMTQAEFARLAGNPERAVKLARETARRVEQGGGDRSPWLPSALHFLAEQLHLSGQFDESEKVYERTLVLQRRRRERDHPEAAVTLRNLAQLHLSRGNAAAAEMRFSKALDIRRSWLGDRHPDTAESLSDLAWLLYGAGNLMAAEGLFRSALDVRRECLGPSHPETLTSQHGLALVALARGTPVAAADLLEQGLALIGDDHPQKLPLTHTLARACYAQDDWARSLSLLNEVLRALEKTLGVNHEGVVSVLADLALVHNGLGDYLAARELLDRIRTLRAQSPVPDPAAQAFDLLILSDSHRQLNDLAKAGDLARQALEMARCHLKQHDPAIVNYLTHFARTCQAQRAFSGARHHLDEALALVRKMGGDHHPLVPVLWADLAVLEVSRGKPRRATPLYTKAADLLQTICGEDHPHHAVARRVLGQHLQSLGEYDGAEEALRRHLNIVLRTFPAEHPTPAMAHQALSVLQQQRGDLDGAMASCRQAIDLIRRAPVPLDAAHANLLHGLAMLCRQKGQLQEAANLLGHALNIDQTVAGDEDIGHLETLQELALVEAARSEDAGALRRLHSVLSFQSTLTDAFAYLPPGQVRDCFLAIPWRVTESLLTLALRVPDAAESALAAVLRWKGLKPADFAAGDRVAICNRYPKHARELDRLFDLSVQIALRLVRGAGREGLQMHRDLLRRWEEEQQGLEGQLARSVPVLARLHALRSIDLPGLRRTLPASATYIEFVRFQPRDFAEVCAGREGLLPPRYLGFVLHAGDEKAVMCDLGRAADVEGRGGAEVLRVALAPHLTGREHLLIATDGRLSRSACIHLGGSQTSVCTLDSGREIVSPLLAPKKGWLARLRDWLRR